MPGRRLDRREALLAGLGAVASLAGCSAEFDTERRSTTTGGNATAEGTTGAATSVTRDPSGDASGGTTAGVDTATADDTATGGADDTADGETDTDGATTAGEWTEGALGAHPMYQYDAANTGYSAEASGPSGEPTPAWSAEPGGEYVFVTPAVYRGNLIVGGGDGSLATYDAAGEQLGSHALPGGINGLAVSQHTAYCGFAGEDGNGVAAVHQGETEWTVPAESQVVGAPTIHDRTVYATAYNGAIRAIDAETGDVTWGQSVTAEVFGVPAVADGSVYVATNDGVFAFGTAEGDQEWHYQLGSETEARFVTMAPAVADGAVVFGDDEGYVYAVETDGTERWTVQPGTYTQSSPAVADGTVYLGVSTEADGDLACTVHAYDLADGSEVWSTEVDAGMVSGPEVAGGTVYLADRNAGVHALAADGGEYLWSWAGTDSQAIDAIPAPAVADDTVYVGAYDGSVYALRA